MPSMSLALTVKMCRVFCLFYYILSICILHCCMGRRLVLPQSARLGYPVIDLGNHIGRVSLDMKNDFAHYFTVDDVGRRLLTKRSLNNLVGASISLDLLLISPLADNSSLERVESLTIQIVADEYFVEFDKNLHFGSIGLGKPPSTVVTKLDNISLKSGKRLANVRYALIADDDEEASPFQVVTVYNKSVEKPPFAQIRTRRKLTASNRGFYAYTLIAESSPPGNRAEAKIEITVEGADAKTKKQSAKRFHRRYFAELPWNVSLGTRILDVGKRDFDLTYHLEPSGELVPFEVDAFSGEVFTTSVLVDDAYKFDVVAADGSATRFRHSVKVVVDLSGFKKNATLLCDEKCDTTSRYKRALRPEISMNLYENLTVGRFLPERIHLTQNERVKNAPIEKEFLTIYENGSMVLTRPLNYETVNPVQVTVLVQNLITLQDTAQRVVINVLDVDEKPKFVNVPTPFLAVVPVEVPLSYTVFTFVAKDEDGDGDGDVEYKLISTDPPDSFTIDSKSGRVKSTKTRYEPGRNYVVYVQAHDKSWKNASVRVSDVAKLDIKAGTRPPQFHQESYRAYVAENSPVSASVAQVKAMSFANNPQTPIRFSMFVDGAGNGGRKQSEAFSMEEDTGVVHLLKKLDYDDPFEPRSYKLKVFAAEGGQTSDVSLEIEVLDVNDNDPSFTQPLYTASINENHPIGQRILQVSARDKDGGRNGEVVYSVDNGNFTIDRFGVVSPRSRLDADQKQQGVFTYRFNVIARDRGDPSRFASSQIDIKTQNVNDEAPFFVPTSLYTDYVAEDAQGNTPILYVQAQDPDRDQVKYSFINEAGALNTTIRHFEIDKDTGLIKLREGVDASQLHEQDSYELFVVAVDDSSCCQPRTTITHTSTATVRVAVKDVNNNKPVFKDCDTYSRIAHVPEGKHKNHTILTVNATDDDSGLNGDIFYSLYYPGGDNRHPFDINPRNGVLTASPYVEFDREVRPFEDVIVKATDKGSRPLIGFCHFTVTVDDENDNSPLFDKISYETSISRSMAIGQSALTVFADDRDGPSNSKVTYSLKPDSSEESHADDYRYFKINEEGGEIILTSPVPSNQRQLIFFVAATDNGDPPRTSQARIQLNILEATQYSPTWQHSDNCRDNVSVPEDVQINYIFFECYAVSGTPPLTNPISYSMRNGQKPTSNSNGDFREFQTKRNGKDWIVVRNLKPLDHEKITSYELTISATDMKNGLSKDKTFRIFVEDKNDNVPKFSLDKFVGQVEEEKEVTSFNDKPLVKVVAKDNDNKPIFRDITYSILPGPSSSLFRIDSKTGNIYPLQSFDREKNDSFILDVQAEDGAPSDLPGSIGPNRDLTKVQIVVQDINDNSPYFNETVYRGRVRENAESQQNVMTVKAHDLDKDSDLRYSLDSRGNGNNSFAVNPRSGTIYVYSPLDYEKTKRYNLTLYVTDGTQSHQASTRIEIEVDDVNDNAPQFEKPQYTTSIQEEEKNPRELLQVRATDRDEDAASRQIIYKLVGQGANVEFKIDDRTGVISTTKPLDRDPPNGIDRWNFVVQAIDDNGNGLVGYTDVQVTLTDINDNKPVFENGPFIGYVTENQEVNDAIGVYVRTMTATDHDDPRTPNAKLTYDIQRNKLINHKPVFRIESQTGKIFAMMKLDRENNSQREFEIEIKATDQGNPFLTGSGVVVIKVTDVNDNAPTFDSPIYYGSVKETAPINSPIMSLSARDIDTEAKDNVLHYNLVQNGQPGLQYVYISTDADNSGSNVGILRVKQPLDFEDKSQQHGFNVTVNVTDGRFSATTNVHVRLLDQNDNPPEFQKHPPIIYVKENAPVDYSVFQFVANDRDFGGHDPFQYVRVLKVFSIPHSSDPNRQFKITRQTGVLQVAKPLDRETVSSYRLQIVATDESNNTGSTFLNVYLEDVNDNAPYLNITRPLIARENQPPNQFLGTVVAYDPDMPENGPPFTLRQDESSKYKDLIRIVEVKDPNINKGNGAINVTAIATLDREGGYGKVLEVPIYVRDAKGMAAVRILPIIIGDENDNFMKDGKSSIKVFNYKGELPDTRIGRVFVEDPDDWDQSSKRYKPKELPNNFEVNNEGDIIMKAGTEAGRYTLKVSVEDTAHKDDFADGQVEVVVETLSQDAVRNAGSIRVRGVSQEDFLRNGYEIFQRKLADLLGVPERNVQIFAVLPYLNKAESMHENGAVPYVDVYFAAFGSPYKSSVLLNGEIALNRQTIQTELGGEIVEVNIDPCIAETCTTGGCTRSVNVVPKVASLIMANRTSLVGVVLDVSAVCECPTAKVPIKCQADTCFGGGICHNIKPQVQPNDVVGFFCECQPNRGQRCEGRTRSFLGGESYAWFKEISSCNAFTISFEFATNSRDAVLLYNGPMTAKDDQQAPSDFLLVEIRNGYLHMYANLGNGVVFDQVMENKFARLVSDGEWHQVDIFLTSALAMPYFSIILDRCASDSGNGLNVDSQCRMYGYGNVSSNEQLNVRYPLQLGGVAKSPDGGSRYLPNVGSLTGCMRNLIINGELYDMDKVVKEKNSNFGCTATESTCKPNTADSFCSENGECLSSLGSSKNTRCVCDLGFYGDRCEKKSIWKHFESQSFVQYRKVNNVLSKKWTKMKILFAPSDVNSGELMRLSNEGKFMNVEITNKQVSYNYQLSSESNALTPKVEVHSGVPYVVEVERFSSLSRITVDGLSDSHTSYRAVVDSNEAGDFEVDPGKIFLGAANELPTVNDDFQGCMREFSLNDDSAAANENGTNLLVEKSRHVSESCSIVPTCANALRPYCADGLVCLEFWKGAFCTCPPNVAPVIDDDGTLKGCGETMAFLRLGITNGAVAAILISLLALIILVLILVVYSRRRRKPPSIQEDLISRENIRGYNEEGGGEEDQDNYNIAPLRKPVLPTDDWPQGMPVISNGKSKQPRAQPEGDLDAFLADRLQDADNDPAAPPFDELRVYEVEGDNISVASLSSLSSSGSDVDWDDLNDWGPRFKRLADLYGGGENE